MSTRLIRFIPQSTKNGPSFVRRQHSFFTFRQAHFGRSCQTPPSTMTNTTRGATRRHTVASLLLFGVVSFSQLFLRSVTAQEYPLYDTPKFDYTTTHRTNVCSRSKLILNDTNVTVLKLEGSQEVFFGVANPVRAGVYMYRECTSSKSSVRSSGNTTCIFILSSIQTIDQWQTERIVIQ